MQSAIKGVAAVVLLYFAMTAPSAATDKVCIDPGHGGPDASKYGPNGDGFGSHGPVYNLSEQWVNLEVAFKLADLLTDQGIPCEMTRMEETEYWSPTRRANFADSIRASHFISIHHNGDGPTTQGTEVFWCDAAKDDQNENRNTDSLLAKKILLRLLDSLGYSSRCYGGMGGRCTECVYTVLAKSQMASALSEASYLSKAAEEALFNDPNSGHIAAEAGAIFTAIKSHIDGAGIACIRTSYNGGTGQVVIVDGIVRDSPFERCWLLGERHTLEAYPTFIIGNYEFTFHHWGHLWDGSEQEDPHENYLWVVDVTDFEGLHEYVAYYTGGDYSVRFINPSSGPTGIYEVEQQVPIEFEVSPGADQSTHIELYFNRNADQGGQWEYIATYEYASDAGFVSWTATGPYSDHCKFRLIAVDKIGNTADAIQSGEFSIVPCARVIQPPTNLYTNTCGTDFRIQLHWNPVPDIDGYKVYRDGQLVGTWPSGITEHIDVGLTPGQTYEYEVVSYDGECTSPPAGPVSAESGAGPPAAPTNLQVTKVQDCVFRYTWHDNSVNEDGFIIWLQYYDAQGEYRETVYTRPANTTQYESGFYVDNVTATAQVLATDHYLRCSDLAPRRVESNPSNSVQISNSTCPVPEGCPAVYVYDGSEYVRDNTILAGSEKNIGKAGPGIDRYVIDRPLRPGKDELYRLRLEETEKEISRFNALRLIGLRGPENENIGMHIDGAPVVYSNAVPPSSCLDHHGCQIVDLVCARDGCSYAATSEGSIVAEFAAAAINSFSKTTSAQPAAGPICEIPPKGGGDGEMTKISPDTSDRPGNVLTIEALDADGVWHFLAEIYPRARNTGPVFYDIGEYRNASGGLTLRHSWPYRYATDQIALYHLDKSQVTQTPGRLVSATDAKGQSLVSSLQDVDSLVAVLRPGDIWELAFAFDNPGQFDGFILESYGYYNPDTAAMLGPGADSSATVVAPSGYNLTNTPNPFNAGTQIHFHLPQAGQIKLEIYDVLGRHMATLVDDFLPAGAHSAYWNGTDEAGVPAASGIYLCKLSSGDISLSRKLSLVK